VEVWLVVNLLDRTKLEKYLIYFLSLRGARRTVWAAQRSNRILYRADMHSSPLTSGFFTAQAVHSNDMTAKRVMKNMY